MRKLLQIGLLLMMSQMAWSANRSAASCSQADVNTAISSASNGDTVLVPAGSCSYTSTVSFSKAITLLGCASPDYPGGSCGTTTITNNQGATPTFQISNTGTNLVRVSGFKFQGSSSSGTDDSTTRAIDIYGPAAKFRVDHSTFDGYDCAVCTNYFSPGGAGKVAGVVDHNTITNSGRGYFAQDGRKTDGSVAGSVAWSEFIGNEITYSGNNNSDKVVYFEDNTITWNRSLGSGYAQGALYSQYGGKVVFRHNTITGMSPFAVDESDSPSYGTIFYEIYNNVITEDCSHTNYGCEGKMFDLRSGQMLIHDNTITSTSIPFELTVYPNGHPDIGHDIKNSLFWNNTWNGKTCQSDSNSSGAVCLDVASDTQRPLTRNTNYWLRAPQSGDVYFPYTPLTYPHPLTQNGPRPAPPTSTKTTIN